MKLKIRLRYLIVWGKRHVAVWRDGKEIKGFIVIGKERE
jgi:hypothetical protein